MFILYFQPLLHGGSPLLKITGSIGAQSYWNKLYVASNAKGIEAL